MVAITRLFLDPQTTTLLQADQLVAIENRVEIGFQIARSGTLMMAPMVQYLMKIRSTAPLAADDSAPGSSPPLRFALTGDRIALRGKRSSPGDNSSSWPSYPPPPMPCGRRRSVHRRWLPVGRLPHAKALYHVAVSRVSHAW
jgi:hypothetical protein